MITVGHDITTMLSFLPTEVANNNTVNETYQVPSFPQLHFMSKTENTF